MVDTPRRQQTCASVVRWLLFAAGWMIPAAAGAQTILVPAGGDLQAALDTVQPGGTVLLEAGATFAGKYTLSAKDNPDGLYITVRSAGEEADLPAPGVRITPAYSDRLAKIQSTDGLQGLYVAPGASYWRVQCLEFLPNVGGAGDIVRVGSGLETVATNQPHHIVFERLYVHGDPATGQRNGIVAHAAEFTLRDSYLSDMKLHGVETHAFSSYNGPGPYLLENNYLEASSINIMFGGTDPKNADMVPSDITIRGNHVAKNVDWMQRRADGRFWNVKNLFELKIGRRVTIEGNIFENNWFGAGDQAGYAVLLRSESQAGSCTWCETGPVTFQNNIVRHTPAAFSLVGLDFNTTAAGVRMHDVIIRNNLFDDISHNWYVGTSVPNARWALVNGVDRLTIDHNTMIMPRQTGVIAFSGSTDSTNLVFTNNISEHKLYGVKGDSVATGTASLTAYVVGHTFVANVLAGGTASAYPSGNYFPAASLWSSLFADYAAGNYRLAATSVYRGAATDGTDIGADIGRIEAATAHLRNGKPAPESQTLTTEEDTGLSVVLAGSDPDGHNLTFGISVPPAHGTLTGRAPNVTYTPAAHYHGGDSFTFAVDDGHGGWATATVTLTVTPVNDAPVAHDQSFTAVQGTAIQFTLAASDPDGDALTYNVPASIPAGVLVPIAAGTYEFVPEPAFIGTASFTYQVRDASLESATATVVLTMTKRNNPPTAEALSVATGEDAPVSITLVASDPDDDPLVYIVGAPTSGSLIGVPPTLTYIPAANFNGAASFSYTVTDPAGASATAVVSVIVAPANDAPVVSSAFAMTAADTPVTIVLTGTDADGDALQWSTDAPRYGSLSGTAPNVIYTPGAGFVGVDSFAFTASDGVWWGTAVATVHVTGTAVTITTSTLADGTIGRRYSQSLQAIGGAAPYRWSISSGTLPPGLTLARDTGHIAGVTWAAGTYPFVVQVTDRWNQTHSTSLSIRVVHPR